MEQNMTNNHITIGILAHVDAGKTTLSEAMLYSTGQTMRKRRVFKQLWDIRNIFRELQKKRMPMKYLKEYLNEQKN